MKEEKETREKIVPGKYGNIYGTVSPSVSMFQTNTK
jgi:hypothetical protein